MPIQRPLDLSAPLLYPPILDLKTPIMQEFGVNERTYKPFGLDGHNGLDLGAVEGVAVLAALDGEVIYAGEGVDHFLMGQAAGQCVLIRHQVPGPDFALDPTTTILTGYAHLSRIYAEVGSQVKTGAVIGLVGQSGYASGPHLHFEVIPEPLETANGYLGRIDPLPSIQRGVAEIQAPHFQKTPAWLMRGVDTHQEMFDAAMDAMVADILDGPQ